MSYAKTVALLKRFAAAAGPYAFIELVLPGGTLIAGALWILQRKICGNQEPAAKDERNAGIWRTVARCGG